MPSHLKYWDIKIPKASWSEAVEGFVKKWVDVSSVINKEDYFDDLNSDCQSYVMQLDKYKDLDYDKIVDDFDKPIEIKIING